MNLLNQLYTDFVKILQQSVIKYNIYAEKYETLDMKKAADQYINAYHKKDAFETYYHYDRDIIADLLGLDLEDDYVEIEQYYVDNQLIPFELRDQFLERQRSRIIANYLERNEYYRMLNGLPGLDDTDYIYLNEENAMQFDLPQDVPIHRLREDQISLLQTIGVIDDLITKNPDKAYLKFLGANRIDIVTARTAKNFAMIRIPYTISSALWDRFALIYEQCREYFMSCIYITEYRQTIEYYDNFIAMCIMVMTIQQVIARVIKDTIDRNFFDDYCIRTLFSVYGVPYYTHMDTSIKTQLVQNLNLLVQNKGTNKVIYDIASILGFDRLKVYKYYLMKVQKFNIDGTPVVATMLDDMGQEVPDYERMFDIYFQKVELKDLDTYRSLLYAPNKVLYRDITENDPFWQEDDELFNEIYEAEYNFVETKYLGVSVAYKLSRILFENIYLIKMIFEKKDEIPRIKVDLPKISPFMEVSLFDAMVALCAITCKQQHLKGEILTSPSKILHVMGFNFNIEFEKIRQDILTNQYLDDSLVDFFDVEKTYTVDRVNALFEDIEGLYKAIIEKMSTTQELEVYEAYRKLYETLFYTTENQTMFRIGTDDDGNPVYAKTFMEYLEVMNHDLFTTINSLTEETYPEVVNHICQKIMDIIPYLEYFGLKAGRDRTVETILVELIQFFKSYTTDMLGLNIVYIFDMKPEMLLRFIEKIHIDKSLESSDNLNLLHADHLTFTSTVRYHSDLYFIDKIGHLFALLNMFDPLYLKDAIKNLHVNLSINDENNWMDLINRIFTASYMKDELLLKDHLQYYVDMNLKEQITLTDYIKHILINSLIKERMNMMDTVSSVYDYFQIVENLPLMKDLLTIFNKLQLNDQVTFQEFVSIISREVKREKMSIWDVVDILSMTRVQDTIFEIVDRMISTATLIGRTSISFSEALRTAIHDVVEENYIMFDTTHTYGHVKTPSSLKMTDSCIIAYSE